MSPKLNFTTVDVFTSTRFLGNPLAIVRIPKDIRVPLSQDQKQTIAREFNLSETVFLHEGDPDAPIKVDIFTINAELPFAGHPTIGSGWYLLSKYPSKDTITLQTKAGNIPVVRGENGKIQLQVPTNFKIHQPCAHPRVKLLQPRLGAADYVNGSDGPEAVVSIVKGMTFILLHLTSQDALTRLQATPEHLYVPDIGEWDGFVGLYAFYEHEDGVIRTRMFDGTLEDPATGSAASTLGGWLAKKRGEGRHKIYIRQGVEMGRKSDIEVVVDIGKDGEILKIQLAGTAVEIMDGSVVVPEL